MGPVVWGPWRPMGYAMSRLGGPCYLRLVMVPALSLPWGALASGPHTSVTMVCELCGGGWYTLSRLSGPCYLLLLVPLALLPQWLYACLDAKQK